MVEKHNNSYQDVTLHFRNQEYSLYLNPSELRNTESVKHCIGLQIYDQSDEDVNPLSSAIVRRLALPNTNIYYLTKVQRDLLKDLTINFDDFIYNLKSGQIHQIIVQENQSNDMHFKNNNNQHPNSQPIFYELLIEFVETNSSIYLSTKNLLERLNDLKVYISESFYEQVQIHNTQIDLIYFLNNESIGKKIEITDDSNKNLFQQALLKQQVQIIRVSRKKAQIPTTEIMCSLKSIYQAQQITIKYWVNNMKDVNTLGEMNIQEVCEPQQLYEVVKSNILNNSYNQFTIHFKDQTGNYFHLQENTIDQYKNTLRSLKNKGIFEIKIFAVEQDELSQFQLQSQREQNLEIIKQFRIQNAKLNVALKSIEDLQYQVKEQQEQINNLNQQIIQNSSNKSRTSASEVDVIRSSSMPQNLAHKQPANAIRVMQSRVEPSGDQKTFKLIFWVKHLTSLPQCKAILKYDGNKISQYVIEQPRSENEDSKIEFQISFAKTPNNLTFKGYLQFKSDDGGSFESKEQLVNCILREIGQQ